MAEIHLEGLSKTYAGGVRALVDLNLTIHDGERMVLVGPSGCGKTTTLRLIAGLEEPTTGTIRLGGQSMRGVPPWRRELTMVFQKPVLLPGQNVRDNLNLGQRLRQGFLSRFWSWLSPNVSSQETEAAARMAQLLGLDAVLARKPGELSGGQLQRVALGRALLGQPAARLLDEPLGHLDGPLRGQLRRELHLLQRQFPATMVYVTHDPQEALALGQRIAILHEGVLQQVDTPENLLSRPRHRFVAEFFQVRFGPMNFLAGRVQQDERGSVFRLGGQCLALPAERDELWRKNLGRDVLLGVRPEDICIQWEGSPSHSRRVGEAGSPGRQGSLEMRVLLLEACDEGTLATCVLDGMRVSGYLGKNAKELAVDERATVTVQLRRAFLFDQVSGWNLEGAD